MPRPNYDRMQWDTNIPIEVGAKINDLLAPYCEASHGECSFGRILRFPNGGYMIIGTTDDDVGSGFTWIMHFTPAEPITDLEPTIRHFRD